MTKPPKIRAAALCLAALAACSTTPPIEYHAIQCPPVPQCIKPARHINTNAELAQALLRLDAAFDTCKLARDSLQACINQADTPIK